MLLKDKIAVVTGASAGIGKSIVDVFLNNGARVIGLDIINTKSWNDNLVMLNVDVANTIACEKIYRQIITLVNRIDVLVNCAGITRDAMTKKMTEEQFDQVISVNLKGVWNLTRLIGPVMQSQSYGSIINISSVARKRSDVLVNGTSYREFVLDHYGKDKLNKKLAKQFEDDLNTGKIKLPN